MSLGRNVIWNYLGQGWSALLGVVFVPAYASAMGVEAYGLVGAFSILYAGMSVLDAGLLPTLSRELARFRAGAHAPQGIRDLLRSLEFISACMCLCVIAILWFMAPILARDWLNVKTLSTGLVVESIRIMAFLLAGRWLEQVFRGALQGLEDFVWINLAQVVFSTLRWAGAFVVVTWLSASVIHFFYWQVLISVLTLTVLVARTYYRLPRCSRPGKFSLDALIAVRGFAGGMLMVSVLAFILTQIDRIAVSSLLPLEQLGLYSIAAAAAAGLLQVVGPISTAIYPRLTQLVTANDGAQLRATYIRVCEWMALAIVPPALLMAFLAKHVLQAWSNNPELSETASPLLALLAVGTLCNGLMTPPYMLQLAHGWTSLAVRINVVAVAVAVPAAFWATPRFGALGAASIWVALNLSYVFIGAHLMYRRLVPDLRREWYLKCVWLPLITVGSIGLLGAWIAPEVQSRTSAAIVCIVALAFMYAAASLSLAGPRHLLINAVARRFSR